MAGREKQARARRPKPTTQKGLLIFDQECVLLGMRAECKAPVEMVWGSE